MYLWFHRCMLYIFRFTNVCIHNTYIYMYTYTFFIVSFLSISFSIDFLVDRTLGGVGLRSSTVDSHSCFA